MEKLNELRSEIEIIDSNIIDLLVKRFEIAKKIGLYKKENSLPVYDPLREEELIKKNLLKVDSDFKNEYREVFEVILKVSKDIQL